MMNGSRFTMILLRKLISLVGKSLMAILWLMILGLMVALILEDSANF